MIVKKDFYTLGIRFFNEHIDMDAEKLLEASETIEEEYATCKVISTTSTWYGVTYKEDADKVKQALKEMVDTGEYPNHLWD